MYHHKAINQLFQLFVGRIFGVGAHVNYIDLHVIEFVDNGMSHSVHVTYHHKFTFSKVELAVQGSYFVHQHVGVEAAWDFTIFNVPKNSNRLFVELCVVPIEQPVVGQVPQLEQILVVHV